MTEFIVHGVPGSPYVRTALLGLEEKGATWQLQPLGPGQNKSAEHLARHPFGRMPVLDHGSFRLYESQAILRYVDRIIPDPPLTPIDPRAEARMNQVCGITDWYVHKYISSPITFARLVAPRLGLPVDERRLQEAIPQARMCVSELSRLLGSQQFFGGAMLSIADILLAPQLSFFALADESRDILRVHPTLEAWIARMNARPAMQRTTWDRLTQDSAA